MTRNAMAREKALYDGHPVAAVAATSKSAAKAALKLIKVDYEVLPHVIDPVEAMHARRTDPARLHAHQRREGRGQADQRGRAVRARASATSTAGFAEADVIVEHEYRHQADAPGLHRAAGLRRLRNRGRSDRAVVLHTGAMGLPRPPLQHPQDRTRQDPHPAVGNGRRLRWQDRLLPGTDRDPALTQGQAAGEDRAHPQRGVPRHRSGLRHQVAHQDRPARRTAPSPPPRRSWSSKPAPSPARPSPMRRRRCSRAMR